MFMLSCAGYVCTQCMVWLHASSNAHSRALVLQGLVEALYNLVQSLLYSVVVYFMVGFDLSVGAQSLPLPSLTSLCTGLAVQHLQLFGLPIGMVAFGGLRAGER